MSYDSRLDTHEHIALVRRLLDQVVADLLGRAEIHDASKLVSPEREMFDEHTPRLRELEYGSPEYEAELESMGKALQHHYGYNRHHPEHHQDGFLGMNLVDVIEMLADWRAACERHDPPTDLRESIAYNAERFAYDGQVLILLQNTARDLGWT